MNKKISHTKSIFAKNPRPERRHNPLWRERKIEQIVNVHEISCNVHEMFTVYPLKTHFHETHNKLTNS